jgi:hypothetical protein
MAHPYRYDFEPHPDVQGPPEAKVPTKDGNEPPLNITSPTDLHPPLSAATPHLKQLSRPEGSALHCQNTGQSRPLTA